MSWKVHREWLFVNAHVERSQENRLAEENENSVRIFSGALSLGFGAAFQFADEGGVFFALEALLHRRQRRSVISL
jgi:hypothetical protein